MNDTDHEILAFERDWWRVPGNKERVIEERFGLSPTRYYQRLNRLLDEPDALAEQPALVRRLQRMRSARQVRRTTARRC